MTPVILLNDAVHHLFNQNSSIISRHKKMSMNTKKLIKIISNIILLVCFLLTYFLDLTGLKLHQFLGIGAGVVLIVHIITHAAWIRQVSKRFFRRLNKRVRFYYILDIILLASILNIILSGIFISTWLMIDITLYPTIRSIHIISSIIGLLVLIIKMVFHWKFLSRISRLIARPKQDQPILRTAKETKAGESIYTRREALKVISAITVVGGFGLYKAVSAMEIPEKNTLPQPNVHTSSAQITPEPGTEIAQAEHTAEPQDEPRRKRRRGSSTINDDIQVESETIPTPETTPFPITESTTDSSYAQDCIVRCPRECKYPGKCSRYIDENNNQLCDLGECLII